MSEDGKMLRSLFWNDQAKQRYFNVSRAIIGCTRIKDFERDAEMDKETYQNVLTNIKSSISSDTNKSVDLAQVVTNAVTASLKAAGIGK